MGTALDALILGIFAEATAKDSTLIKVLGGC